MATPEQNALLALQLFGQPAQQFAQANDARTNLLMRLALTEREEQARRELANQGYAKSIELANMQAGREDARWRAQGDREDARMRAANERASADRTAAERRESERQAAADTKQLRASIASTYPKYAAAATQLGEEVLALEDFEETWQGLGKLQAEMARLEQTRVRRDQEGAAEAVVGELDDAQAAVRASETALQRLARTTPEDERFARAQATAAVRTAIETGGVEGLPKAGSEAAKKGLAALVAGDMAVAGRLLGGEVLTQFESAYQASLQAAPNFKSRMQQLAIAQQNHALAQRNLATIQSDLRRAAAGNNALATRLTERRSGLQQLMAPAVPDEAEAPRARRSMEEIFAPKPGAEPARTRAEPPPSPTTVATPREPEMYTDLSTLTRMAEPVVEAAASRGQAQTRAREAIGDRLRQMGYGVSNFFRPSNWRAAGDAVVFDPAPEVVIPQLQGRLDLLTDPTSVTAQRIRSQLELLLAEAAP